MLAYQTMHEQIASVHLCSFADIHPLSAPLSARWAEASLGPLMSLQLAFYCMPLNSMRLYAHNHRCVRQFVFYRVSDYSVSFSNHKGK